jgi:flavodoxin
MKTLVLCYSLEGNTKVLGEALAQGIDAEFERLIVKKEIKSKGFGKFIWGGRQVFMGKTPEIEEIKSDIDEYDLIIVGTPVWAFTYAPAVRTLLSLGLINNKKVAFFCTHEGGPGKTIKNFASSLDDSNKFLSGIELLNDKKDILQHRERIIEWANGLISES